MKNSLLLKITVQRNVYTDGLENDNMTALTTTLTEVSTILGFLFGAGTVVGAVSGLIATLGSDLPNLKSIVDSGSLAIADAENWLLNHSTYDMIEINYPFIEYVDANINESTRFVEASDSNAWKITGVRIKGGSGW